MNENREHCKRIAEELEAYINGDMYKCPECGEVFTFNNSQFEDTEDGGEYTCQYCKETFKENELEALNICDYFNDILDCEFTCNSRKEYKGVKIWVALGGPNVWIDTNEQAVKLAWGTDRESYYITADACDAIDDYFEEFFNIY